jgi:hypothetical protein
MEEMAKLISILSLADICLFVIWYVQKGGK